MRYDTALTVLYVIGLMLCLFFIAEWWILCSAVALFLAHYQT